MAQTTGAVPEQVDRHIRHIEHGVEEIAHGRVVSRVLARAHVVDTVTLEVVPVAEALETLAEYRWLPDELTGVSGGGARLYTETHR